MPPGASDSTTKLSPERGEYELLVTGDGSVSSIPLPLEGELLIGRAEDADLRLTGNSISRRHALLRVGSFGLSLEDLGSANGTMVGGERAVSHRAVDIAPGQALLLGEFVLVVRARRSRAVPRQVWTHEAFEARLSEQCERSREAGSAPFYVLRIAVEPQVSVEPAATVAVELKASDLLCRLSSTLWAVLLLDDSENSAGALAARLERALEEAGCPAKVEVLVYPRDGISAGALLARIVSGPETDGDAPRFVLRSPMMVALHLQMQAVARSQITVLILGETGVGKDVLARNVHEQSERADKPFLRVNCAALPEQLLESELFGYEKGAFTGATQSKPGLLLAASGGTVFLDEIGELPARLQPKLLQVLETREILSIGSVRPRAIDVRFLAATNRDLELEAAAGEFRSDLYYRLAGFTAVISPLRERREDILPLAQEFLSRARSKLPNPDLCQLQKEAADLLLEYAWPGNVRELRNVIERAVVLAEGKSIGPEHLPLEKMRSVMLIGPRPTRTGSEGASVEGLRLSPREFAERDRILEALASCAGNQSKAAERLGVSRSTLLNRLDAYRIGRPRKRPE